MSIPDEDEAEGLFSWSSTDFTFPIDEESLVDFAISEWDDALVSAIGFDFDEISVSDFTDFCDLELADFLDPDLMDSTFSLIGPACDFPDAEALLVFDFAFDFPDLEPPDFSVAVDVEFLVQSLDWLPDGPSVSK